MARSLMQEQRASKKVTTVPEFMFVEAENIPYFATQPAVLPAPAGSLITPIH